MASSLPSSNKPPFDAYRELADSVKNNKLIFKSSAPFEPSADLTSVLPEVTPSYPSKLKGKSVSLANPLKASDAAKKLTLARARRKEDSKRKSVGIWSRDQILRKGAWKPSPEEIRYVVFLGLNELWNGYVVSLLGLEKFGTGTYSKLPPAENLQSKLVKADFHGCLIKVKEAKNKDLIGVSGIVIHETENTVKVVTKKDQVKVLPKSNSIFTITIRLPVLPSILTSLPNHLTTTPVATNHIQPQRQTDKQQAIQFDLFGDQFRFRNGDRAGRKFKFKGTAEAG